MKKVLVTLFIIVIVPSLSSAKPWYRDWKSWAVLGAAAGSSISRAHNAHACRVRVGEAGPCDGEYTSSRATQGVQIGASVGMFALSLWGRHQGFKEWAAPSLGFSTYNGVIAYRQTLPQRRIGEQPSEKADLSSVVLLHR
jgi:hypothetical protein